MQQLLGLADHLGGSSPASWDDKERVQFLQPIGTDGRPSAPEELQSDHEFYGRWIGSQGVFGRRVAELQELAGEVG